MDKGGRPQYMNPNTTSKEYTHFIKKATSVGFTDDQADFLWDFYSQTSDELAYHRHEDKNVVVEFPHSMNQISNAST